MSISIEEIKEIAEIVAHMLAQDAPDANDVKKEMEFRKEEVKTAKNKDKEIRLNKTDNRVDIYYGGKIIHSKNFTCLADAVYFINKQAREL